jgi:hypothetical protein
MTADQDKIGVLLDHLYYELERGNRFFQIAKALQRAYDSNRLTDAPDFFAGTYNACLRESLLSLAKLTVPDKESITIAYLLNIALQNRGVFQRATPDKINRVVVRHQKRLNELRPLIESVKDPRDRVIVHLDRKHINDPDAIVSDVNMTEVGQCFEELLQMVNTYKEYYDGGEFSLEPIERRVQNDVDYLITLMEKAYE